MNDEADLISVEELFENDEVILMNSTYDYGYCKIINTDVGVKTAIGEIASIVTVNSKIFVQE
ncbi:MAG: hypothetical protein ACI4RR_03765 [Eubacterium sp.]